MLKTKPVLSKQVRTSSPVKHHDVILGKPIRANENVRSNIIARAYKILHKFARQNYADIFKPTTIIIS